MEDHRSQIKAKDFMASYCENCEERRFSGVFQLNNFGLILTI